MQSLFTSADGLLWKKDHKENPLLQDTMGTRDSLRLLRAGGSPEWR